MVVLPVAVGQPIAKVRAVLRDPLYRGSLLMLTNTAALSIFGFAFWTLAANRYPAATVGSFSGLTAGIGLLSTIAALGLANLITRRLTSTANPRGLLGISLLAIAVVGTVLCVVVIFGIGRLAPASLHLHQHGRAALLVMALVVINALSGVTGAGLVAVRATGAVLWTNLTGAVARLTALILLSSYRSLGLILAFSLGLVLSSLLSVPPLLAKLPARHGQESALGILRKYLASTTGNYFATILGILPSTVVPLEVLTVRGAAQTASFAAAFLIAGFLNFIPSTTSQVLFAEASRKGSTMGRQLKKAVRAIYALLLPGIAVLAAGAPLIMRAFGPGYAAQGTNCLRLLALAALFTGGTYLVDAMLIARDRTGAYLFMNGANAALVLVGVGVLLPHGLTGGAAGWAAAQAASLLLGLGTIATGRTGRHRRTDRTLPAEFLRRTRRGERPQSVSELTTELKRLMPLERPADDGSRPGTGRPAAAEDMAGLPAAGRPAAAGPPAGGPEAGTRARAGSRGRALREEAEAKEELEEAGEPGEAEEPEEPEEAGEPHVVAQ